MKQVINMMVSTRGRYALRVLIDLAQNSENGYISLKEISQRQNISMKYLESIVATLYKAGFLESMRGKNGGYKLKYEPSAYTIGSILQLTEGTLAPVNCLKDFEYVDCPKSESCLTLPLWRKLNSVVNDYLESVTLNDILTENI